MGETGDRPKLLDRLEARREAYAERGRLYRVVWVIAGVIVVLAGLAMTVLPGPAVVVIPAGLAMLSFEFAWAQRLLDRGIEGGEGLRRRVADAPPRQRLLAALAVLAGVAAVAWVGVTLWL